MATDTTTELPCPNCGYDLRGQERSVCPECGKPFDAAKLVASKIPWERRKHLGRFRTFFQTAALATFRTKRLGAAGVAPVDYKSARRFQYVVVAVNFLPLLAALLVFMVYGQQFGWLGTYSHWVTTPTGLLLFLLAATGVGSYFFHPRSLSHDRQNRAIAFSYYACAPALFLPCALVAFLLAAALASNQAGAWVAVPAIAGVAFAAMAVFGPLLTGAQLLGQATQCSAARCVAYFALVPILQLILAFSCLIVLPGSICFVELFIQSLL